MRTAFFFLRLPSLGLCRRVNSGRYRGEVVMHLYACEVCAQTQAKATRLARTCLSLAVCVMRAAQITRGILILQCKRKAASIGGSFLPSHPSQTPLAFACCLFALWIVGGRTVARARATLVRFHLKPGFYRAAKRSGDRLAHTRSRKNWCPTCGLLQRPQQDLAALNSWRARCEHTHTLANPWVRQRKCSHQAHCHSASRFFEVVLCCCLRCLDERAWDASGDHANLRSQSANQRCKRAETSRARVLLRQLRGLLTVDAATA